MKHPKIRPEQLEQDYRAPHRTDGQRQTDADGRLVTKASFTSSVRAQEKAREQRSRYFASNVYTTHATTNPEPWRVRDRRTVGAVQPPPNGGRMHYERPLALDTDLGRIVRGHAPTVYRWLGVLEEYGRAPADILAALRHAGYIETSSSTQSGD